MRLRFLAAIPFLLASAAVARADVTYDVLFTSSYPVYYPPTAVGTIVLNTPPPSVGTVTYSAPAAPSSPYVIDSLDIYPATDDFNLSDIYVDTNNIPPVVQFAFTNGTLTAVSGDLSAYAYRSELVLGPKSFAGAPPLVAVYIDGYGSESSDLISLAPANRPATPTPEPSSLALLGSGLLSALGAVRTRFRS